jgi:hypothetical protein
LVALAERRTWAERICENMVLRRIFEPKREKVTGEWKKLHDEELNELCPHQLYCK